MTGRHEDERGVIQDLLEGRLDAVTEIFTKKGAVRGNHVHAETIQWTYVVSGKLLAMHRFASGRVSERVLGSGELLLEPAGVPHAWQALEDTRVLVFTRGPRSGAGYENDTQRLAPEDRLIP